MFALACAPVTSDTLGGDNSREILSELRKINENLEQINKYLDKFERELQTKQSGTESERIFKEINEILREQKARPSLPGLDDPAAGFR
ncbi:MAG: hypothetical protein WAM94_03310 [Chromatiaceae bacterium]